METGCGPIKQIRHFFSIALTPESVVTIEVMRRIPNIMFAITWFTEQLFQKPGSDLSKIISYIIVYYCQVRLRHCNDGLATNVAERNYWIDYNTVATIT